MAFAHLDASLRGPSLQHSALHSNPLEYILLLTTYTDSLCRISTNAPCVCVPRCGAVAAHSFNVARFARLHWCYIGFSTADYLDRSAAICASRRLLLRCLPEFYRQLLRVEKESPNALVPPPPLLLYFFYTHPALICIDQLWLLCLTSNVEKGSAW